MGYDFPEAEVEVDGGCDLWWRKWSKQFEILRGNVTNVSDHLIFSKR